MTALLLHPSAYDNSQISLPHKELKNRIYYDEIINIDYRRFLNIFSKTDVCLYIYPIRILIICNWNIIFRFPLSQYIFVDSHYSTQSGTILARTKFPFRCLFWTDYKSVLRFYHLCIFTFRQMIYCFFSLFRSLITTNILYPPSLIWYTILYPHSLPKTTVINTVLQYWILRETNYECNLES